ncbi:hypothetical protein GCM10020221_04250 [Streptomyces thioluteus]|uniref:AB hydrolase-1 domain-containing protein n=1 Tax=Streptomyces thioluteus TaxID=66431 RepID=A0ABN3WEA0_STRTU
MSPPRPRALTLASAALALVLAAACGPGGGGRDDDSGKDGSRAAASRIDWKPCAAPTAAQGGGKAPGAGWECASLPVPLDYAQPDGKTIDLALIRARATDEKHRIGSLVFNFGGPGGSGVATLPSFAKSYADLRKRYDLVSFDPRGVGESAGVRCLSDKELDAADRTDATPDDEAELAAAVTLNRRFAQACGKNSGPALAHVDTLSAARDMDRLRAALGDDKLRYFGISYGTELGAVYAHLFPKNVGRAVLDAVVDPRQDPAQGSLAQAKGFQLALGDFLKDCGANCPSPEPDHGPAQGPRREAAAHGHRPLPVPGPGGERHRRRALLQGHLEVPVRGPPRGHGQAQGHHPAPALRLPRGPRPRGPLQQPPGRQPRHQLRRRGAALLTG